MFRKVFIALAVVLVGLVILKKTTLGSLVQVWCGDAWKCVGHSVSPETQIKQLRLEIAKIDEDVKRAVNNVVRVEMARKDLSAEVEALKDTQEARKQEMRVLVKALKEGTSTVSFKNSTYSGNAVQDRLDTVRKVFERDRDVLKQKEQMLQTKTEHLQAAEDQIAKIKEKKVELQGLVEDLELNLERLRLAQTETNIQVNDGQLRKAQELYQSIRKRLAEEEVRQEQYAKYGLTGPLKKEKERAPKASSIEAADRALEADGVAGDVVKK